MRMFLKKHWKKLLAGLLVILAAALGGLYLYADYLDSQCYDCNRVVEQAEIAKVIKPIRAGQMLRREHLTTDRVPKRYLPPNPVLASDIEGILGRKLGVHVEEGQMLLRSDLEPTAQEVFAKLSEGMRAYPLSVPEARALLELMRQGDRLEVIFTESATGRSCTPMVGLHAVWIDREAAQLALAVSAAESRLLASLQQRGQIRLALPHAKEEPNAKLLESCEGFEGLEDVRAIHAERKVLLRLPKVKQRKGPVIIRGDEDRPARVEQPEETFPPALHKNKHGGVTF